MKKSVTKKILVLAVAFAMILQSMMGIVFADVTLTGDGSAENPYQIGTYAELAYFRDLASGGTQTHADKHVILTADIAIPNGVNWYQLGVGAKPYSGTFNGNGHKITNLNITTSSWHMGFFGWTNGATIKNLTIEGNVTSTAAYAGGLVGQANNTTIENCTFKGNVTGVGGTIAGFIGRTDDGNFTKTNNTIKNCIFIGDVKNTAASGNASGFAYMKTDVTDSYIIGDVTGHTEVAGIGWQTTAKNCFAYGTLTANTTNGYVCRMAVNATNCYYLNHVSKNLAGQGTQTTAYDFASGKIAYDLGDAFGQTIGTDSYPVFRTETNKVLYENGTYKNEGEEVEAAIIEIGSYNDLVAFRNTVNAGKTNVNAILTADIELPTNWSPIAFSAASTDDTTDTDIKYTGTFDGNGHKITNFIIAGNYLGLFGYTEGATIKNLTIEGGTRADGKGAIHGGNNGAFVATAVGTTIENCKFIGNVTGYSTIAGFIGNTDNAANAKNTILNSAFIGNLTSDAGIVSGYARGNTLIKNSYLIGDVTGKGEVSAFGLYASVENCFIYGTVAAKGTGTWDRAYPICTKNDANGSYATNSYYFNATAAVANGVQGEGAKATDYDFKSGRIAYILGAAFGQTIGTDDHPVFRTETNKVITNENGEYINEGGEPLKYVLKVGTYQELAAFRDLVDIDPYTGATMDVILTADITIPDGINWYWIGNVAKPYSGTFDGNGHKITNLNISTSSWHAGFFGWTNGATIKNLTIEGNVTSTKEYVGGLIGTANNTTIENVIFKGNVTGVGGGVAGFIGRTDNSEYVTTDNNIKNCAFIGDVTNSATTGNASGFAYMYTNIENSYYIGNVKGAAEVSAFGLWTGVKNSFVYGNVTATNGSVYPISAGKLGFDNVNDKTAVSNCYYSNAVAGGLGTQAQIIEFINGKVAYLLNKNAGEIIFGQTLNQELYPSFYNNNMVYSAGSAYSNTDGAFAGVNANKATAIASTDTFVMVAQYAKNGEVETLLEVTPVNVSANQLYTQAITPISGANVYKVFVWNSMTGMVPVCDSVEYIVQ